MRKVRYAAGRLSELTIDVAKTVPLTKEVETEANRSGSSSDGGKCTLVLTGGKVYAVGSLCPHQNAPLDGAKVEGGRLVCRRHGYCFDLKTGDCTTIGGYGIPVYETEVDHETDIVSVLRLEFE